MNHVYEIRDYLATLMKVQPEAIGIRPLQAALRKVLGTAAANCSKELLSANAQMLERLIDEVVIPESWFFREEGAFLELVKYAQNSACERNSLTIMSVPCARGEEVYSIAMTLHEAGLKHKLNEVIGVDISSLNVSKTKTGVYTEHSFRGSWADKARSYLQKAADGMYYIPDYLKEQVSLKCDNAFNLGDAYRATCDVVFCRNLLIYLGKEEQSELLQNLVTFLKPGGLLMVAAAEAPLLAYALPNYQLAQYSACLINKRKVEPKHVLSLTQDNRGNSKKYKTAQRSDKKNERVASQLRKQSLNTERSLSTTSNRESTLVITTEEIVALANSGEYERAREYALNQQEQSAELFLLLALLAQREKKLDEAKSYYRKALYLDPSSDDAALGLAAIESSQGRSSALRKRAQRSFNRREGV
jgi:chemotaxis protein methyltransferase WspC